jgi:hypothetical protein
MNISRRRLGVLAGLTTAAAALSACTVASSGGTTTATLNVAKVQSYFTAGVNAANTLLAIPAVSAALGAAGVAAVGVTLKTLTDAMTAFTAAAGSSVEVSITTTSVKTAFDSGLAAIQSLLTQFKAMITSLVVSSTVYAQINLTVSSLATIVSIAAALLPVSASVSYAADQSMSESQALANLGVR